MNDFTPDPHGNNRRDFLRNGMLLGTIAGFAGLSLVTGCKGESGEGNSPAEVLVCEHGVLDRVLLIYDAKD
jgi:hypothetical protein